jgi:hypothetical protein
VLPSIQLFITNRIQTPWEIFHTPAPRIQYSKILVSTLIMSNSHMRAPLFAAPSLDDNELTKKLLGTWALFRQQVEGRDRAVEMYKDEKKDIDKYFDTKRRKKAHPVLKPTLTTTLVKLAETEIVQTRLDKLLDFIPAVDRQCWVRAFLEEHAKRQATLQLWRHILIQMSDLTQAVKEYYKGEHVPRSLQSIHVADRFELDKGYQILIAFLYNKLDLKEYELKYMRLYELDALTAEKKGQAVRRT